MGEVSAISNLVSAAELGAIDQSQNVPTPENSISFSELIRAGLDNVESRVDDANNIVNKFTIDDSVPIHQVTVALEEARIAVELALQVRSRLIEGYREIMNMQI